MKKYLLLALWAALSMPAFSQQWRIAPTLGVNMASVSLSSAYKADLNSGTTKTDFGISFKWQLGAFAEYPFSDRFAFRTGLFYTPKGCSATFKDTQSTSITLNGRIKTHYIEVPILANVAVGQKGFRLIGGPIFGAALGGQFILDPATYINRVVYGGSTTNFSVGNNANDGLLPTETSLLIGLIRERDRLGFPVEIGVYSQIGLSNWDPGVAIQSSHSIRNGLFGLKIAYFFEVGR